MAGEWITVPLEELVRSQTHPVGAVRRCRLCNDHTVPLAEQTADEQIRIHLERYHEAVAETATNRTSARLRRKLTAMGWTPPLDDAPGLPDPARPPEPPPEIPGIGGSP